MIGDDVYNQILEDGLLLDHYYVLCRMKNGEKPVSSRRVQGFINLLTKKEYLKDDQLTEKAELLVENCATMSVPPLPISEDFTKWITELHIKCRDKIKKLTDRNQAYIKVNNVDYPYLPGVTDLGKKLEKFIRVYKHSDREKIEKCLLRHCDTRNQKMIYYIMREKENAKSDLASDYENFEDLEDKQEYQSQQKFV